MSESSYLDLVPDWHQEEDRELARTRIFTLRRLRASSPRRPDRSGRFVYLDCGDWVNVVALTPDRRVVTIEQFRHGLAEVTLEIPGGMVDPGETPLEAGLRELREETGHAGDGGRVIGRVSPNPAIQNNFCHTVLVDDVAEVAPPEPEEHEEIGVRLVPLEEIPGLIADGVIHHALVVAAFHHLMLLERR